MLIIKTIIWRILSLSTSLCLGRLWFGDWHVTEFTIFITIVMMIIYYIFELIWNNQDITRRGE